MASASKKSNLFSRWRLEVVFTFVHEIMNKKMMASMRITMMMLLVITMIQAEQAFSC